MLWNVTPFGNKVFVEVMKMRALNPMIDVFTREMIYRHQGDTEKPAILKAEAEIGVMGPQAKECQGHLKLQEGKLLPRAFEGRSALVTA